MFKDLGITLEKIYSRCKTSGDCHVWQGPVHSGLPAVYIKDGASKSRYQTHKVALCLAYPGLDYYHLKAINKCGDVHCVNPDHWDGIYTETPIGPQPKEDILPRLREVKRRKRPLAGHVRRMNKTKGIRTTSYVYEMTCYHCLKHITGLSVGAKKGYAQKLLDMGFRYHRLEEVETHFWSCPSCVQRLGLDRGEGDA